MKRLLLCSRSSRRSRLLRPRSRLPPSTGHTPATWFSHMGIPGPRSATWSRSSRRTSPSTTTSGPTRTPPTATASLSTPLPHTPAVDGLTPATSSSLPPSLRHSSNLLVSNPNAALPQRLDSNPIGLAGDAGGQLTCDQDHNYSDEQQSFDGGLMDQFVAERRHRRRHVPVRHALQQETVMDYYDGNTVTGLWNYAQHYAMSDNSYGTTFGPPRRARSTSSPATPATST